MGLPTTLSPFPIPKLFGGMILWTIEDSDISVQFQRHLPALATSPQNLAPFGGRVAGSMKAWDCIYLCECWMLINIIPWYEEHWKKAGDRILYLLSRSVSPTLRSQGLKTFSFAHIKQFKILHGFMRYFIYVMKYLTFVICILYTL